MKMTEETRDDIIGNVCGLCDRIERMMGGDDWGEAPHNNSIREKLYQLKGQVHGLGDTKLVECMMFLIGLDSTTQKANEQLCSIIEGL